MDSKKVAQFMALAGQPISKRLHTGNEAQRKLGAQLLLSEVLEYLIEGLGVIPEFNGQKLTHADSLQYEVASPPNEIQMLDGLSDVAYTMQWNAHTFGIPLEEAYELVCDNNLEKFVLLGEWAREMTELPNHLWHCNKSVTWPSEVVKVEVIPYEEEFYAVGKDNRGKVRKPGNFKAVCFDRLLSK